MTHQEALRHNRAGLEPSDCPGELRRVDSIADADGVLVEIFRCRDCETAIPMSDGRARNAYPILFELLASGFTAETRRYPTIDPGVS